MASIIGKKPAGAAKRKKRKTAKPGKPAGPNPVNPAPGGTTTDTTTSPNAGTGTTAADEGYGTAGTSGALTSATTTAPVPDESGGDNVGAFFSSGTGPALHYHQEDQMAESPEVQDAGASA